MAFGAMLTRRRFLLTSLAGVLAAPIAAAAQQAGKTWRIGLLGRFPTTPATEHIRLAFLDGLRERGYTEGGNVTVEYRFSHGLDERWPRLVRELLDLGVEIIVTSDSGAVQAIMKHATRIPVVMLGVNQPVEAGFALSLARPGGNITGLSNQLGDLNAKHLQILREIAPRLSRVAVLWNPVNPGSLLAFRDLESVARTENLKLEAFIARTSDETDKTLAALVHERPHALFVHAWYTNSPELARIVQFTMTNRIPTVTGSMPMAKEGVLISYAPDIADTYRRGAYYVDKIFKGARAADLPIEQPTKFELVINLKTAKALGLTISPSLLARADQVIE